MIKVYVAGASRNLERSRAFMDRVRKHPGMTLTHDWVASIERRRSLSGDEALWEGQRILIVDADLIGIERADAVVFLAEENDPGHGMFVELGFAICLREERKLLIIVSGGGKQTPFTVEPRCSDFESPIQDDEEAFRRLEKFSVALSVALS